MANDAPTNALVDELAGDGEFVAQGGFSVDVRQAGDKLQAFRLAEPGAWISLLIEGAIAAGTSTIEIEFSRGEIELELRGLTLSPTELDRLGVLLSSAPRDPCSRAHAVYLLGLAYQAAHARVDGLLIESGTRRLRWTPAGESNDELDSRASTRVLIELGAADPERRLLLERCAYAQIDVFVDGEQIAWGWRRAFGARESPLAYLPCPDPELLRSENEDEGEVAGLAGFAFDRVEGATLYVLMSGVLIEAIELGGPESLRRGFVAVIEAPELGRDLGLTKLTRDARFDARLVQIENARARLHDEHETTLDNRRRKPPAGLTGGSMLPIIIGAAVLLFLTFLLLL